MNDSISRQAAIEIVRVRCARIPTMAIRAMQEIKDLPAEEPERKRGRWIEHNPHKWGLGIIFECSECGYEVDCYECNFCPHCGADMRGNRD